MVDEIEELKTEVKALSDALLHAGFTIATVRRENDEAIRRLEEGVLIMAELIEANAKLSTQACPSCGWASESDK